MLDVPVITFFLPLYSQAFGLADLFAADETAKQLVEKIPLYTYVPVENLSLKWGSDKNLVSDWLRAKHVSVRRLARLLGAHLGRLRHLGRNGSSV